MARPERARPRIVINRSRATGSATVRAADNL